MWIWAILLLSIIAQQSIGQRTTSNSSKSTTMKTSTSPPKSTTSKFSSTTSPKSSSTTSTKFASSTTSSTFFTTTSMNPTTTTKPSLEWSDPYVDGKIGNPGADFHLSNKTIDLVHVFAAESFARRFQNASIDDLSVPMSGSSTLIIKTPRISESKFPDFEKEFIPTNRLRSKFFHGKIEASGEWQYKSATTRKAFNFLQRAMSGVYRTTITNGELESIIQLSRTFEAKPMLQIVDCRANFSQFHVDIEGAGNTTLVENCDDPICRKIRTYFEDVACQVFRNFIKDVINTKLATFPTLIETYSRYHKINYGLQMNEPKVSQFDIQAGLEGKSQWYGNEHVPFYPVQLNFVDKNRMATFELSDYAFNALLYQAHWQRFPYSASELLPKSPTIKDQLMLNCSKSTTSTRKVNRWEIGSSIHGSTGKSSTCMGSIFDNNSTSVNQPNYGANDTGDMIYKSHQRAPSIIVQSNDRSYFDASNGILEIYGPIGQDQKRQLLGRAAVRVLRGEFVPKFNSVNITGSMKITKLELGQSLIQERSLGDQWLSKLTQFAQPLLTDMFNVFFERYAQFSIPMLDGFKCASPDFMINNRSIQVDCDIQGQGQGPQQQQKRRLYNQRIRKP